MAKERVMVVEDDVIIADTIKNTLTRFGYSNPVLASSGETAIEQVGLALPDLILMDVRLAGEMDGVEAAKRIKASYEVPVVYLTAYADEELLARAKVTEPYGYLVKPFHEKDLHTTIQMALHKHQMDRRLKESEERYRAVMEQAFDGILLFDAHTREILESNTAFRAMLGYAEEETCNLKMGDITANDMEGFERDVKQVLVDKRHVMGERQYRRKDGSAIDVWVSAAVIRDAGRDIVSLALHDLSEQKQAEEHDRLLEAHLHYGQKMESLGTMAGAMAHTFNNIFAAIIGNAEMLELSLPEESKERHMLSAITTSGMRAVGIIRQIIAYTGHIQIMPERVDLSKLLIEMKPLLESGISKNLELICELSDDLPPVYVDPNQIRQAVMSLFVNAVEAMGEIHGVITLSSRVINVDSAVMNESYLPHDFSPGRYVILEITDTGSGMDEATVSRIFDPFFTTKFPGRGLGLSAVLGIVRRSKGVIKVFSKTGEGTKVWLGFPAAL